MSGHHTAAVFMATDIPTGAKNKDRKERTVADLSATQQTAAAAVDVVAIVETDGSFTILAPAGDVASAVDLINQNLAP